MSAWDHFYQFWISQQTIPGNILGDVLIGAATFMVGKYKVAPWLHARHKEHLEQKERHHQEIVQAHRDLFDLHGSSTRRFLTRRGRPAACRSRPHPRLGTKRRDRRRNTDR